MGWGVSFTSLCGGLLSSQGLPQSFVLCIRFRYYRNGDLQMNTPIDRLQMSDVGTRLEHLIDLHALWSWGLHISTQGYQTTIDIERAKDLTSAIKLLDAHMEKDFKYVDYAKVINELPKDAKDIA